MFVFTRIIGVLFTFVLGSLFALRFHGVRERLFGAWPQSRNFLNTYYPERLADLKTNLRRRNVETTRTRYGENIPGEA